jgi:hypothetical protein
MHQSSASFRLPAIHAPSECITSTLPAGKSHSLKAFQTPDCIPPLQKYGEVHTASLALPGRKRVFDVESRYKWKEGRMLSEVSSG